MNRLSNAATRFLFGLVMGGTLLLTGCERVVGASDCDEGKKDWEMESFGITMPEPVAVNLQKLPMQLIGEHYVGPFRMVAELSRGDYAGVQAHWDSVAAIENPTEQMRAIVRSLDALEGRGLALLHSAQKWHATQPDSVTARLMLGATLAYAGRQTDNEVWDPKTTPSHFHRLRSRMKSAAQMLEPLLARDDMYGRAAKELNLPVGMQLGASDKRTAWTQYLSLMDYAPHYEWLYLRAAGYAVPEYSGDEAESRRSQLEDLALVKSLPEVHRVALRQTIDEAVNPPNKIANPQAWRPYWEARVKAAPTVKNLVGWMYAESAVSNWHGILDISEKIIAQHPHHRYAWEQKSWALQQIGRLQEAYDASLVAITLGSDNAMNRVIRGYVSGEMGLAKGDWDTLLAHCQFGAVMALGAAYNCMGSSFTDGFAGVARNERAALAWHLLGAQSGHFNSQHDVAVLLPKIITEASLQRDVDHAAGHWLRRASVREHQAARNKLEQRPSWGEVCRPEQDLKWLEILEQVLLIWLRR